MMHRAWSSIVEVPHCFSRSSVKFQGHTALKIVEFDPNWAFPDSNSSSNSPMAMKCFTKLETAKERCPIVFQGHPSNFKVTRDKTSPNLTQIGRFRTIGRSQLSNPSDLPCFFQVSVVTSDSESSQQPMDYREKADIEDGKRINPLRPGDAYLCHWTGSSLIQVMACHIFSAKPLSEPK